MYIYLFITLLVVCCLLFRRESSTKNLPPGPVRIPVVGHLLHLNRKEPCRYLRALGDQYGSLFTIYLGSTPAVFINDHQLLRKLFAKGEYSSRPVVLATTKFSWGKTYGIINTSGQTWTVQRRLFVRHLKEYWFENHRLQDTISSEVDNWIGYVKNLSGRPFDPTQSMHLSMTNITMKIVTGDRFQLDDSRILNFLQQLNHNMELFMKVYTLGFLPAYLRMFIPGYGAMIKSILDAYDWLKDHVQKIVNEHKARLDPDFIQDYIDAFLVASKSEGTSEEDFNDKNLIFAICDLLIAGGETTASTLRFAVMILACHQELQMELLNEIKTIVLDREITISDKPKLPKLNSFISEVQRFSNVVPLGVMHSTDKATEVNGYHIPKDTVIISNLDYIHRSHKYWKDSVSFIADRFINSEGKYEMSKEGLTPYSTGKRECAGKNIAINNLFLFLSKVLLTFKITLSKDQESNYEPQHGFVNHPKPYRVILQSRSSQ